MTDIDFDTLTRQGRDRRVHDPRSPDAVDAADEIARYFRENYPILLDGAQTDALDPHHLVRQAKESLSRSHDPDMMPAAILREALGGICPVPRPETKAGLTAIGPKAARVWWDNTLLDRDSDAPADRDQSRPILRFFDITGLDKSGERWHETFDIEIDRADQGKTVQFWQSNRTYVVELGHVYADGRFVSLARTNAVDLPRDCRGAETDGQTVRSNLRPRAARGVAGAVPDDGARDWVLARPDFPERDIEAELAVHMLYRAFLSEGPRALRRGSGLFRRDDDVLRREYAARCRVREARRDILRKKPVPAFLVAVLDPVRVSDGGGMAYYPVPVAVSEPGAGVDFAWFDQLSALCRAGLSPLSGRSDLVAPLEDSSAVVGLMGDASPVFEAARDLRERMGGLPSVVVEADGGADDSGSGERNRGVSSRDFGGIESRRMAKAGVRVTRMALTIEGRMRPGARLKVGGKLVYADAAGNFRLECVLTGRRASIPLRAGLSVGGEASSVINVDWEKRAGREKKAFVL